MNFDQSYNPDDFARFISDFLPDDFTPIEQGIDYQASYIQKAKRLGACKSLELEVFEVQHNSTHDARVGLSREAVKMLQHHSYCNRALIAFVPTDNSLQWRFSLLHIELEQQDHSARLTRIPSNPRRYSFLLGEGSKVKTPQQFLQNEGIIRSQRRGNKDFTIWDDLCYRFSVEVLTKEFYKELSEWYEWAKKNVTYPNNKDIEEHLIRLVTRLMFVWFIKQNDLIPESIFDINELQTLLNDFNPYSQTEGNYYNAILQNLFFATLNCPINERKFTSQSTVGAADGKEHYGIKIFFRDDNQKTWFNQSHEDILKMFHKAPFLNGGLFECLDKKPPDTNKIVYYDGFSRDERNKQGQLIRAFIPNCLFFDMEKGLISILQKYNFTIEENTPNDVDVALDPELLGKVFENLLGAYNPETKETARKQSGSFYTPREIVNYMVDESLISYLKEKVGEQYEDNYRKLLIGESETPDTVKSQIYDALRKCKILDPACGSGAFPMGILNRIIIIMDHLGLPPYISIFDLKRYLIENCIFGIDIQPIAIQISKLRFFISLIVEQKPTDNTDDNYGIKPLPNLETKFVAANTLIGINKKKTGDFVGSLFTDPQIEVTKNDLSQVRRKHFSAVTSQIKNDCREEDEKLRKKLAVLLETNGSYAPEDAKQLADWNPYDQNGKSPFFDADWMFNIKDGFDIVLGNPPYIQLQKNNGELSKIYGPKKEGKKTVPSPYETFDSMGDIYSLFYERGYQLLKPKGRLCFITSNKWMRAGYGENTRKFFAENTNPEQLIDFAGIKVFESATVDTNILMFSKDKNRQQTQACIVKKEGIKDLSVFIRQSASVCSFGSESWVVLSPIEQSIKAKIEAVGIPLKDWDINIYRGVLTGYNEAFIISGDKRKELIAEDPRSDEIIRPILRGRDIKRYCYDFADLWLINTHNGVKEKGIKPININDYPAIKEHLDKYYASLERRQDKGDTPYNLRNCAYIEDFYKQKIVWKRVGSILRFCYDENGHTVLDSTCFATGNNLKYLLAILNSKMGNYMLQEAPKTGTGDLLISVQAIEPLEIPVPVTVDLIKIETLLEEKEYNAIDKLVYELYRLTNEEINFIESQKILTSTYQG